MFWMVTLLGLGVDFIKYVQLRPRRHMGVHTCSGGFDMYKLFILVSMTDDGP